MWLLLLVMAVATVAIRLSISCYNVASIKRQVFIVPHHLDVCVLCCVCCHRDVIDPSLRSILLLNYHVMLLLVAIFYFMVLLVAMFCSSWM